jgi:ABC-type branched-subunit amino acid transport system ATPase component
MPTRLTAFGLSGAIAGLGGATLGGLLQQVPLTGRFFQPFESLRLVSMAVMGGIGTVFGPVLGAFWSEGLRGLFPDNELVPLFTSSLGLLLLLMYLPGGLMQLAYSLREWIWSVAEARTGEIDTSRTTTPPATLSSGGEKTWQPATLAARDIGVRFGGVAAVNQVSIDLADGEIVGLIGTNGAGKSTLMNAIGGYVNATGRVELMGEDVSGKRPSERARRGLGRTFQAATLFPELTVRETVQVALEARGHTRIIPTALHSPWAAGGERARKAEADELINFLGLGRYANNSISELSTGTRRIVELAGLFAVNARVLCLDEPTAGVAQRESEAFGDVLLGVRRELDASILIIEHDMPMIMSVSDRVYCLELGQVIAEGTPTEVRNDPMVIASYLGTDERAIARSDN